MNHNMMPIIQLPEEKIIPHTGWDSCKFLLNPITACIRYTIKHPVTAFVSITSSLAGSLYSLTFYSGKQPEDISGDWWYSMSQGIQFFSIFNALVSISMFMLT